MSLTIGLSFVALWIGFFWLYRDYAIDRYRQRLFALRDEVWDFAASGRVGFDEAAYRLVRDRINGLIRFAHLLSLTWIVTVLLIERWRPSPEMIEQFTRELATAMERVREPAAERLKEFHHRAILTAIEQVLLVSPVFWLGIFPTTVLIRLWRANTKWLSRGAPPVEALVDTEAARLGALA